MQTDHEALARALAATSFQQLFMRSGGDGGAALWSQFGADAFAALIRDADADPGVVFLAAEIGRRRDALRLADAADNVARGYAHALADNATGATNPWGLPGEIGPTGHHLIELGAPAVAALRPLLDDDTPAAYAGSEEATIADGYRYRVKDLAAFFISQIAVMVYPVHRDPAARDVEIEAMQRKLDR